MPPGELLRITGLGRGAVGVAENLFGCIARSSRARRAYRSLERVANIVLERDENHRAHRGAGAKRISNFTRRPPDERLDVPETLKTATASARTERVAANRALVGCGGCGGVRGHHVGSPVDSRSVR